MYANNGLLHFMIKHHVLRHLNFVNNLYDKIADEETRGKQVVNIRGTDGHTPYKFHSTMTNRLSMVKTYIFY